MKRFFAMLLTVAMVFSCVSLQAFATDDGSDNVEVYVEYVDYDDFSELGNEEIVHTRASVVDLSEGDDYFNVGVLDANESYTTSTYNIAKTTLSFSLTSYDAAAPNIRVTLYKANGSSVAVTTVSLVKSSLIGGRAEIINFTNLDSASNYYAVIKNIDTAGTGNIVGYARQK